jgi:hypothetical protein
MWALKRRGTGTKSHFSNTHAKTKQSNTPNINARIYNYKRNNGNFPPSIVSPQKNIKVDS